MPHSSAFVENEKHNLFISAYLIHNNAQRAALEAGMATSKEVAKVIGCRLLKRKKIHDLIQAKLAQQNTKSVGKLEKERDSIVDKLHNLIEMAIANGQIKSAVSAISELNKMRGNYAPLKSENTNYDGDKDIELIKQASDAAQKELNKTHKKAY